MRRRPVILALLTISLLTPQGATNAQRADPSSSDVGLATSTIPTASEPTRAALSGPVGDWKLAGFLTHPRGRTAVVFSPRNGRFYAVGGEGPGSERDIPIEEYNPKTNTWRDRADLLTGVSNTGAAAIGRYIYVPGGFDGVGGVTAMQRYDVVTNEVDLMAPMPDGIYASAVTAFGPRVHVLGGSPTGGAGFSHYVYDTRTNEWFTRTPLPVSVQYAAATTDGTYIYVLGGNISDIPTLQRFDPVETEWSTVLAPMNVGRGGLGAFFDGETIWAVGGGWFSYFDSTESYDPVADEWSDGPTLNAGARSLGVGFGNHMAVKAGGWNGSYLDAAERLVFAFSQPDGLIKAPRRSFKGGDVYNRSGRRQVGKAAVARGGAVVFRIKVQNDGNVPDSFRLKGNRTKPGFEVAYLAGGRDVTKSVVAGRFRIGTLQPGRSKTIRLRIAVQPGASAGPAKTWKVLARSRKDGSARDAVKASVRVV